MQRPLLVAAIIYMIGVLLGEWWPLTPKYLLVAVITATVASLFFWWLNRACEASSAHSLNLLGQPLGLVVMLSGHMQSLFTILMLLLAGWANMARHNGINSPYDLRALVLNDAEIVVLRGSLLKTPDPRNIRSDDQNQVRLLFPVAAEFIKRDGEWHRASGCVMINTLKPSGLDLYAGRQVELDGVISRPRAAQIPDVFDYRQNLQRRDIHFVLKTDQHTEWRLLDNKAPPARPMVDRFRAWASKNIARGLPGKDEALELLWAMSLGWRTALTGEVKEPFMRSGTMHLFAISGLHIAMVAGILVALLTVFRLRREHVFWVAIPLLWFYTAATGWQPSAVRATIMMTIIIFGWSLKRPVDLLNSIGAAAFVILLWNPQQLFQASFQLSFTVVFGLALVLPSLVERLRPWVSPDPMLPRALWSWWQRGMMTFAFWFINAFATSLTAWLASVPLIACYFNLFTPVSILANVPVVLCGMLALMSCFGSLLCGAVLLFPVAELFNHSAWFFMACMMILSEWATKLPGAYQYVRVPDTFFFVVYYVTLFGLGTGWLLRRGVRWWAVGGLAIAGIIGIIQWQEDRQSVRLNLLPGTPAILQEDFVGCSSLLIDTGDPRMISTTVIPALRARGVDKLEDVVLTHASKHQAGGLTNLIQVLPPRMVHRSYSKMRITEYTKGLDTLFRSAPNLENRISAGDRFGVWEVIHPPRDVDQSRNIDDALVMRSEFHGVRILLMSDLGELGQETLVTRTKNLCADLVVTTIPNHGEPLQPWLLDAIRPTVILVHDSRFPLGERASTQFKSRMEGVAAQVFYTTEVAGTRVEFAPNGWRILNASGILWDSR